MYLPKKVSKPILLILRLLRLNIVTVFFNNINLLSLGNTFYRYHLINVIINSLCYSLILLKLRLNLMLYLNLSSYFNLLSF